MTIVQSNSQIFTTTVFGTSTNDSSTALADKNLSTIEQYLESSGVSNLGTRPPIVPSNQKIAKD